MSNENPVPDVTSLPAPELEKKFNAAKAIKIALATTAVVGLGVLVSKARKNSNEPDGEHTTVTASTD